MDGRPSGCREAPVDRTRRTGRLVRRPPLHCEVTTRGGLLPAICPWTPRRRRCRRAPTARCRRPPGSGHHCPATGACRCPAVPPLWCARGGPAPSPRTPRRGCRAAGGRRSSAGPEGVPVVLPLRDGSPGGSHGTAAVGPVLCPATFSIEVPFVGRQPDYFGGYDLVYADRDRPTPARSKAPASGERVADVDERASVVDVGPVGDPGPAGPFLTPWRALPGGAVSSPGARRRTAGTR